MTGLEPASFEVERFELGGNARLEVRGRWFGVRGRRFMRPALTAVADGREQRILAVLDHKPWDAEEGETWLAAFPCSTDPAALVQAELTVAPDVTVPLPRPSTPATRRRPRRGAQRSSPRPGDTKVKDGGADRGHVGDTDDTGDSGDAGSRLRLERDAALRSRDEAVYELRAVKRECERLRGERHQALAAREAAIAARHESIEAEVSVRSAELRAEAERERAGARLAARTARERDEARATRDEAARERDEARAECDDAQRSRNRMLAERDTARTRVEEVTRQWELTAGLGARRTQERDALAAERDRVARERDVALKALDAAHADRDDVARVRDVTPKPREPERDEPTIVLTEHELLESQAPPVVAERAPRRPRARRTGHEHGAVGTGSAPAAPGDLSERPHDSAGGGLSGSPLTSSCDCNRQLGARVEVLLEVGDQPGQSVATGVLVEHDANPAGSDLYAQGMTDVKIDCVGLPLFAGNFARHCP